MNRSVVFFDKIKNQFSRSSSLRNLTLGMIVIGVILRLFQYSLNRSLWLDESLLALNIVNKTFIELLRPLDSFQVAPIGFLFIEKTLLRLLGNNEYVLRLFPLIAGIVSLFLFYHLARRCIREESAFVAVGLFALSGHLIYYSSEIKQYSSDVAITLLLMSVTIYMRQKRFTNLAIVFFGAIGGIAVWFSLPSLFVLAGIGCTLSVFSLARRDWSTNYRLLITYFIWFLSFFIFYWIYSRNVSSNLEEQQLYWNSSFMPFPPRSISDIEWFGKTFFGIFKSPLSLPFSGLGALAFLLGAVSIFSRDKQLFFILLSPILFALLASGFHLYPFTGRVITFIIPLILLFIGESVTFLSENSKKYSLVIKIILIGLLFCMPLTLAANHTVKKTSYAIKANEDIKPVMKYLKEHKKQDDVLYLYCLSEYSFNYYSERYGFTNTVYIKGVYAKHDWNKYLDDIQKLRGNKRVWLIFSHTYKLYGSGDKAFILDHLDCFGERLDNFKSDGAEVYLYDLS